MASQTELANRSIIKLGGTPITDISDNIKSARTIQSIYDTCRKAELSKRYWNFALSRASLPALGAIPAFQFGVAYQLPVDFLKPVQIGDYWITPNLQDYRNSDESVYAIEGQTILTDFGAPLHLRYVRDETNEGKFDALFDELFACKMAYEACYAITQSRQGQQAAIEDYKMALKDASFSNAIARPPVGIPDDSWQLSRL